VGRAGKRVFFLREVADLGRHAERDEVTDLLLLRLSERQAGALDVGGILATATASSPDGASLRHLAAELSDPGRKPTPHEPIDGAKRRRRRSRPQAAR